jgi:hypothetical protein
MGNCYIHNKTERFDEEGDRIVSLETRISYLGGDIPRNMAFLPLCVLCRICVQGNCCTPNSSCRTAR